LRQVGSVRLGWGALAAIPAVALGADDGARLTDALAAGRAVRATLDVAVATTPSTGSNVVGRIDGSEPGGALLVGAHFDTWFAGASDNGGGVATMLALAERWSRRARPRHTLVFIGYDGEEVALYGGYHFLRRHVVVGGESILAVLNFEVPSAVGATLLGLGRSNHDVLVQDLDGLSYDYPLFAGLEFVPILFGGIIPTDIQGIYRDGVPTASTAVDAPYYHTVEDTPDKVDVPALSAAADDFDRALVKLAAEPPERFAGLDDKLWTATVTARPRAVGEALTVEVAVQDAFGQPQAAAPVGASLLYDDFFEAAHLETITDGSGAARFDFAAADTARGQGDRWVHVTAGPTYPLVEKILPVD
jgi:hypothetical protein